MKSFCTFDCNCLVVPLQESNKNISCILCGFNRLIYSGFSGTDPNKKDNSVGIQLLGLAVANNFPPYDPKCGIDSDR